MSPTSTIDQMAPPLQQKYAELCALIERAGGVVVAFSGGVDSSLVAFLAHRLLGERALAITADSPSVPRRQLDDARRLATTLGFRHEVIPTEEVDDPRYRANAASRCFYCKHELYGKLVELARSRGFDTVFDGTNADDVGDHRPGMRAADEHSVRSPLLEAGVTKSEVRELSRLVDLPTWDKPAAACLSSRVAYGVEVTAEVLARIESGEEALHDLGFRQFRVRHHGGLVRIEIDPRELARALDPQMAARLLTIFKDLGYRFVTLDLEGYRSGSLNADLDGSRSGSLNTDPGGSRSDNRNADRD